jgi:hypothetical protein
MTCAALVVLAACGAAPALSTPASNRTTTQPAAIEVRMERMGYTVAIHAGGAVDWEGGSRVAKPGMHHRTLDARAQDELARAIDTARFFDGDVEVRAFHTECNAGCRVVIDTCLDAEVVTLTVERGARRHTVEDTHCDEKPSPVRTLEQTIDRLADSDEWLGPPHL